MKTAPSGSQARKSILKAREFLAGAEKSLECGSYDSCVLSAYAAAFNAALALLVRDGYRERSHACVPRYLESKYLELDIAGLDRYREMRHADHYQPDYMATKSDAEEIVKFAKKFLKAVVKLLK